MTASQKHRSQIVFKRLLESRAMFQQNLAFCSKILWIQFFCDILTIPIQREPSTSTEKFWGEAQHCSREECTLLEPVRQRL